MAAVTHVIQLLGGPRVLKRPRNEDDLRERVRQGLPYGSFEAIRVALGLTTGQLLATLAVPGRTLARRKAQGRLRPEESDRLLRLARILATAEDTLGGRERASAWLREPNRALGGDAPLDRLDTDLGAHQVEAVLGRIAHGVHS